MEVIEIRENRKFQPRRPTTCPPYMNKCTKRYVQPARVESYAPVRKYCPPTKALEANTTYHLSYLNAPEIRRATPFRPTQSLEPVRGKFEDGTTNRMSYQPVWNVVRAKPIIPRHRPTFGLGEAMQCTTTARHDFTAPKSAEKPEVIVPCANIGIGSGAIASSTTAGLSYMNPGNVPRPMSFKPAAKYSPSGEPAAKDTTHKLSFQPFRVATRETYPWAKKALYRPPESAMDAHTTYSKSYMDSCTLPAKEKPIVPRGSLSVSTDEQFVGKTVYNESFLPSGDKEAVVPVLPCDNISLSHDKMICDTTNKLSYQPVRADKRMPIRPIMKKLMADGPMQCETTNRRDFVPKAVPRPEVIVPCDNIRSHEDAPLEGNTTTALSYQNPGIILPTQSFKPQQRYCRPTSKIEGDTVNKLSYQSWTLGPRAVFPWQQKPQYEPPKERMAGNSIYDMSYPAPGYYVEDCESPESTQCPE